MSPSIESGSGADDAPAASPARPGPSERAEGAASVVLALLAVQVFFGGHYVAVKQVLAEVPAPAWALARVASAALLLELFVARRRPLRLAGLGDWARLAGFALCGVVLNQVLFVEGLARTSPAHASLICTTIPLWALVFAVVLGRERFSTRRAAGIVLALVGVAVLLEIDRFDVSAGHVTGDLMIVGNSACYGLFLVVSKRWLATHDPLGSIARVFALGAVGIAIYGLDDAVAVPWTSLTTGWWAWAAFIVLFATIGAYFLNYWALRRATSSLVALFIYLQPVVATALDGLLRGEWPGARFPVAAVLVLVGVAVGAVASPGVRRPRAADR